MKIRMFLIGVLALGFIGSANAAIVTKDAIQTAITQSNLASLALIDWKVGDAQDYNVDLGLPGFGGTMHKEATKEEGNGIWVKQQLELPIMNDTSEMLMDRNTGKILKFIHNGKEEAVPSGDIEIVKTENTQITVPAGTFKVMHVIAKSKDVSQIELWANPRVISLDGGAKMYMDQGQIKITMELTKFVKN
jgi:hypothetical protein